MISPVPISVLLSLCCIRRICNRGGDSKFSSNLLERCLCIRQSKLMAEESGFRGIAVRCGYIESLGRINERLGLLHKAGKVEHCSCYLLQCSVFIHGEGSELAQHEFDIIPLGVDALEKPIRIAPRSPCLGQTPLRNKDSQHSFRLVCCSFVLRNCSATFSRFRGPRRFRESGIHGIKLRTKGTMLSRARSQTGTSRKVPRYEGMGFAERQILLRKDRERDLQLLESLKVSS
jgi:hypothetical protein